MWGTMHQTDAPAGAGQPRALRRGAGHDAGAPQGPGPVAPLAAPSSPAAHPGARPVGPHPAAAPPLRQHEAGGQPRQPSGDWQATSAGACGGSSFGDRPIVWTYLPSSRPLWSTTSPPPDGTAPGLVLYHCVDEHSAFPGLAHPKWSRPTTTASPAGRRGHSHRREPRGPRRPLNPHTYTVLNAADVELFSLALDPATRPRRPGGHPGAAPDDSRRPRLPARPGRPGDPRPGRPLLADRADRSREIRSTRRNAAAGPANIHFLGEKPHAEIPGYLRGASVAMIPYVAPR